MSRPVNLGDIEIEKVEFGTLDVSKLALDGTLLKVYGSFLEAVQKAGNVEIAQDYRGVVLHRLPTLPEQMEQLAKAQREWDNHQKLYDQWAAGAAFDHEYQFDVAKRHARENDLPMFTWEREGAPEKPGDDLDTFLAKSADLVNDD